MELENKNSENYTKTLSLLRPLDLNKNGDSPEGILLEEYNNMSSYYNTLEADKHRNDKNYEGKDIFESDITSIMDELIKDPTIYSKVLEGYKWEKPIKISEEQKQFYDAIRKYVGGHSKVMPYIDLKTQSKLFQIKINDILEKFVNNNEVVNNIYLNNLKGEGTSKDATIFIECLKEFDKVISNNKLEYTEKLNALNIQDTSEDIPEEAISQDVSEESTEEFSDTPEPTPEYNTTCNINKGKKDECIKISSILNLQPGYMGQLQNTATKVLYLGATIKGKDKYGNPIYKQNNFMKEFMKDWAKNPERDLYALSKKFETVLASALSKAKIGLKDITSLKLTDEEFIINGERYNIAEVFGNGIQRFMLINFDSPLFKGMKNLIAIELSINYVNKLCQDLKLYNRNIKNSNNQIVNNPDYVTLVSTYLFDKYKQLDRFQITGYTQAITRTSFYQGVDMLGVKEANDNLQIKNYKEAIGIGLANLFPGFLGLNKGKTPGWSVFANLYGGKGNPFNFGLNGFKPTKDYRSNNPVQKIVSIACTPIRWVAGFFGDIFK